MKQYQDYKKLFKIAYTGVLLAVLLYSGAFSYAQTAKELSQKIQEKSNDIAQLEKEIKQYQGQLDSLGKEKNSLATSLAQIEITRKKLNADISVTQKKIDQTNFKIEGLGSQINTKEHAIAGATDAVALALRQTNELETNSFIGIVLSDKDFSSIWNDIDHIVTVQEKMREYIKELHQVKGELEDTRTETIDAKNELTALKTKLADQKKIVDANANEKSKLLAQTKNSEVNYQKLLQEQVAKRIAFEKELRNFESQLKFILDPTTLPGPGVLSWPLDEIFVTQEFGAKTGPHRTYASGHSGADFRARTPLPVKAMADGIIKGTGDTDLSCQGVSFGRWIFIEYNNGLSSTYGHLSLIKVREGQKVSRGEVVGYTGGTGRVTGPHLHVSLYVAKAVSVQTVPSISCLGKILTQPIAATNAYLDPMYYLPAR